MQLSFYQQHTDVNVGTTGQRNKFVAEAPIQNLQRGVGKIQDVTQKTLVAQTVRAPHADRTQVAVPERHTAMAQFIKTLQRNGQQFMKARSTHEHTEQTSAQNTLNAD